MHRNQVRLTCYRMHTSNQHRLPLIRRRRIVSVHHHQASIIQLSHLRQIRSINLTKWEASRLSLIRLYRIIWLQLRNARRRRWVLSAVERHRASRDTDITGFSTMLEKYRKLWRQNDHVRRDIRVLNGREEGGGRGARLEIRNKLSSVKYRSIHQNRNHRETLGRWLLRDAAEVYECR